MANTDNLADVEYLSKFDSLPNVDVIDDYKTVRDAVQKQKGKHYKFSYADYICKILLGTIDKSFDSLGEEKCVVM